MTGIKISQLYAPVRFDESVVEEHCMLGYPKEAHIRDAQRRQHTILVVANRCHRGARVRFRESPPD